MLYLYIQKQRDVENENSSEIIALRKGKGIQQPKGIENIGKIHR